MSLGKGGGVCVSRHVTRNATSINSVIPIHL